MRLLAALAFTSLAFSACTDTVDLEDGRDDAFTTDGKADGVSVSPGEAAAILSVANTFTAAKLKADVGLASKAAENIVAVRVGDDESAGTADDATFGSLAQLDAVPYVGPAAFNALLAYVHAHGLVTAPTTHAWQSETLLSGNLSNWALDANGHPVVAFFDAGVGHIRLGDGTVIDLPPEAAQTNRQIAVDATGTVHLFFSDVGGTGDTSHFAYRNHAWVDHGTLPGDRFRVAQNASGKIFVLTAHTDHTFHGEYLATTIHTIASNGSATSEPLWPMAMSDYKLDFEVDRDGFPSITYFRPGAPSPVKTWQHARRGPSGWQTSKVVNGNGDGGNLVAATPGANATVFVTLTYLQPYRQTGLAFTGGTPDDALSHYEATELDAAIDGAGTAHGCITRAGELTVFSYDAAGAYASEPLGTASFCSMRTDAAGTIHMLTAEGSIVNHWTF